ncbi:MAG: lytic transglycosylase domain-containing protein [Nitrospirae bacterium]|nr:lytic transglycosylase domain-containing protein [Nitrospirota bacterium]
MANFAVNIPPIKGNVSQADASGLSNGKNENMNDTMKVLQQPLKGVAYPSVDPAVYPAESRSTHGVPKLDKYDKLINEASSKYGVDPALIKAVIRAESNGNPVARSKSGARGLMQLMPKTATELGVTNSYDPKENIDGGTMYLRQLLDRYNGDVKSALVAYNWGMGNLERRPGKIPADTRTYLAKVQHFYMDYSNGQQMPRQFLA